MTIFRFVDKAGSLCFLVTRNGETANKNGMKYFKNRVNSIEIASPISIQIIIIASINNKMNTI